MVRLNGLCKKMTQGTVHMQKKRDRKGKVGKIISRSGNDWISTLVRGHSAKNRQRWLKIVAYIVVGVQFATLS